MSVSPLSKKLLVKPGSAPARPPGVAARAAARSHRGGRPQLELMGGPGTGPSI
jgi:hypothetical protein